MFNYNIIIRFGAQPLRQNQESMLNPIPIYTQALHKLF